MATRKSSCVNARGIPTAAYQVFHLLSYRGGTPSMAGGTPIMGYSLSPRPDLTGGTPYLVWEYPIPDWGYPHHGVPPILTWDQSLGYPLERTWDQWKYDGMEMEMGYPPGVNKLKTSRTTYAVGNNRQTQGLRLYNTE